MPKIYELVDEKSVETIKPLLVKAVEAIGLDGLSKDRTDYNLYLVNSSNFYLPVEDGGEAAGPLLMATVHALLWRKARFDPEAPAPFTHFVDGKNASFTTIMENMMPGAFKKRAGDKFTQASRLGSEVSRLLHTTGLVAHKKGSNGLWIRAWPVGFDPEYSTNRNTGRVLNRKRKQATKPVRPDIRTEQRIKEESNKPVMSHFTIPELPTEPTPAAIMDWARRTKEAFERLNTKYEALLAEYVTVVDKVEKLEALAETTEWKETLTGLSDILKAPTA